MKATKKQLRAQCDLTCDFCKSSIKRGEMLIASTIYDADGRYTLKHHRECDRTAELTAIAQKEFS